MGLREMRVARPFRANVVMEILDPGLRCAPPWAIIARRFAAEEDIIVRRFVAGGDIVGGRFAAEDNIISHP
jgi:hypothetical protein